LSVPSLDTSVVAGGCDSGVQRVVTADHAAEILFSHCLGKASQLILDCLQVLGGAPYCRKVASQRHENIHRLVVIYDLRKSERRNARPTVRRDVRQAVCAQSNERLPHRRTGKLELSAQVHFLEDASRWQLEREDCALECLVYPLSAGGSHMY